MMFSSESTAIEFSMWLLAWVWSLPWTQACFELWVASVLGLVIAVKREYRSQGFLVWCLAFMLVTLVDNIWLFGFLKTNLPTLSLLQHSHWISVHVFISRTSMYCTGVCLRILTLSEHSYYIVLMVWHRIYESKRRFWRRLVTEKST